MTFLPAVLTKEDPNNSLTTALSPGPSYNFTGIIQSTVGYETIIVSLTADQPSSPLGILIEFSNDGGTTYPFQFTYTYLQSSSTWIQSVPILSSSYRIRLSMAPSPTTIVLQSRLTTQTVTHSSINESSRQSMVDAFGKWRISSPYTLMENKIIPNTSLTSTSEYLQNDMVMGYLSSGSVSSTFGQGKIVITTNGVGQFISQSRRYAIYQPGKSLCFMGTGVLNPSSSNAATITTRIGYFDDVNGCFFQYNATLGLSVIIRNNGTDQRIDQSSWNIDTMNGDGPSGLIVLTQYAQVFMIDMEWLGTGQVRFGFYLCGKVHYCHQVTNLNSLSQPYMTTANLPMRYELTNVGNGTGGLTQICSCVLSEGGYEPIGKTFTVASPINSGTTVGTTETPLLAITGINNYNHENIIPVSVQLLDLANNNGFLFRLRYYPAPSPSTNPIQTTINVNANSIVAYATNSGMKTPFTNYLTGSIIVEEGLFSGKQTVTFDSLLGIFGRIIQITKSITGYTDVLVLTATKTGSTGTGEVFSSLTWQEVN